MYFKMTELKENDFKYSFKITMTSLEELGKLPVADDEYLVIKWISKDVIEVYVCEEN
ncbi:hypothetical protein GAG94_03285 [Lysinibacillus sphaericus]|nr:hypothetical protein GAG94_03285 [Lysinibacillus sphaericus]